MNDSLNSLIGINKNYFRKKVFKKSQKLNNIALLKERTMNKAYVHRITIIMMLNAMRVKFGDGKNLSV